MRAHFATGRRETGGRRRPRGRARLASVAGAVVLGALGALVSVPAGAYEVGPLRGEGGYDGIGIQTFWYLSPDDHVVFKDIGGQCDRGKVYPNTTVRDLIPKSTLPFYLYTAYAGGTCAFRESNAQYRVEVTEPSGKTLWTNINVTENGWSSRTYHVDCYGEGATLPCRPDNRKQYSDMGPLVWFGKLSEPSGGYTYCGPQGYGCSAPKAKLQVAYGADGRFDSTTDLTGGLVVCPPWSFMDPARGWFKSCFYKKS